MAKTVAPDPKAQAYINQRLASFGQAPEGYEWDVASGQLKKKDTGGFWSKFGKVVGTVAPFVAAPFTAGMSLIPAIATSAGVGAGSALARGEGGKGGLNGAALGAVPTGTAGALKGATGLSTLAKTGISAGSGAGMGAITGGARGALMGAGQGALSGYLGARGSSAARAKNMANLYEDPDWVNTLAPGEYGPVQTGWVSRLAPGETGPVTPGRFLPGGRFSPASVARTGLDPDDPWYGVPGVDVNYGVPYEPAPALPTDLPSYRPQFNRDYVTGEGGGDVVPLNTPGYTGLAPNLQPRYTQLIDEAREALAKGDKKKWDDLIKKALEGLGETPDTQQKPLAPGGGGGGDTGGGGGAASSGYIPWSFDPTTPGKLNFPGLTPSDVWRVALDPSMAQRAQMLLQQPGRRWPTAGPAMSQPYR